MTRPQVVSKPDTPRTTDPPKLAENISKTTVSADSIEPKYSGLDVISKILTPPEVPSRVKEKPVVKESKTTLKDKDTKTTLKDKTGFVLPTPKPTTTKPGMFVNDF